MTNIIDSLSEISDQYDAAFVDLWGCVHNGITAYPEAVEALRAFRAKGKTVVLLTNAPRPRASVEEQLKRFKVPTDCWDTIATSGDSARAAMFQGAAGSKVYHIGQPHDEPFFAPLNLITDAVSIERVPLSDAEGIVCTGPFDPLADPALNRSDFLFAKSKGLKLLCANPDLVVDRGETREWCAGTLAALYTEMGGESVYFGKPHPAIYDLARRRLVEAGGKDNSRVLCIGDGIITDVAGAVGEDLDILYITGGLAAAETGTTRQPDPERLAAHLQNASLSATHAIGFLR